MQIVYRHACLLKNTITKDYHDGSVCSDSNRSEFLSSFCPQHSFFTPPSSVNVDFKCISLLKFWFPFPPSLNSCITPVVHLSLFTPRWSFILQDRSTCVHFEWREISSVVQLWFFSHRQNPVDAGNSSHCIYNSMSLTFEAEVCSRAMKHFRSSWSKCK